MAYAMPGIVTGEPKVIAALTPYAHEGEGRRTHRGGAAARGHQIEIERINQQTPEQVLPEGKLKVLIYHTHNTEAYTPDEAYPYSSDDAYRTADNHYNIVAVGEKLTELLTEEGALRSSTTPGTMSSPSCAPPTPDPSRPCRNIWTNIRISP